MALAVALLVLIADVVPASGQQDTAPAPTPAGTGSGAEAAVPRIEFLVGEVSVDGAPAAIGDEVPAGSRVVTGSDGQAEIVFGTGNILQVREDTELVLDLNNRDDAIDVQRGRFAAVFDELQSVGSGDGDTFAIRTPSTVAGVRGTVFFVAVESPEETYVCTCHGTLQFGDDGGVVVSAARHSARRFVSDGSETRVETAPELYHTTEELNRLASVVDVTIAWGENPH